MKINFHPFCIKNNTSVSNNQQSGPAGKPAGTGEFPGGPRLPRRVEPVLASAETVTDETGPFV